MGTASTMASIAEALGMILPGSAAIPAVHADRLRAAEATGRAAMRLAQTRLTPDRIVTPQAVENALRVLMAIGGSTNAVLHLTAIAGRAGIDIDLKRLNEISDSTPVLVDLKPTGPYYMEDLFAAGGIGAVLRELQPLLHLDCLDGRRRDASASVSRRRPAAGRPRRRAAARPSRCSRSAASSRCSARWRRRARSSSARPPTPSCSRRRAARSSSPRSRICRRASTIPGST